MDNKIKNLNLLKFADGLTYLCNDYFNYACVDAITIVEENWIWCEPFVEEFGFDGLNACLSLIVGHLPLKAHQNEKFLEAYKKLKELNPEINSIY